VPVICQCLAETNNYFHVHRTNTTSSEAQLSCHHHQYRLAWHLLCSTAFSWSGPLFIDISSQSRSLHLATQLDRLPITDISIAEASLLALFLETLSCGARSFIEGILPPDSLSRYPEEPCSTLYLPALLILLPKTSIHGNSSSQ